MYLPISSDEYAQIVQLFKTKTSVNIELAVALLESLGLSKDDFFSQLLLEKDWELADYLEFRLMRQFGNYWACYAKKILATPDLFLVFYQKFIFDFFTKKSARNSCYNEIRIIVECFKNRPKTPIMEHFATYLDTYGLKDTFSLCYDWLSACAQDHPDWGLVFADFFLQSDFKTVFLDKLWEILQRDFFGIRNIEKYLFVGATRELIKQRFITEGFDKIGLSIDFFVKIPPPIHINSPETVAPKPTVAPNGKIYAIPRVYEHFSLSSYLYHIWTFVVQQVDLSPFMKWQDLYKRVGRLHFINCIYVNLEPLPNFPKLRELVVEDNRALDFEFLNQYTFSELEYLSLSGNQVEHFPGLNAAYFPKLKSLSLNFGCLQSLDLPEKFPNLQSINISKIPPALQTQAIKKLAALYDLTTLHIYL